MARLSPAIERALATVSRKVAVLQESMHVHGGLRRCWHLSCGQMISVTLSDHQLFAVADAIESGLSLETALENLDRLLYL